MGLGFRAVCMVDIILMCVLGYMYNNNGWVEFWKLSFISLWFCVWFLAVKEHTEIKR